MTMTRGIVESGSICCSVLMCQVCVTVQEGFSEWFCGGFSEGLSVVARSILDLSSSHLCQNYTSFLSFICFGAYHVAISVVLGAKWFSGCSSQLGL